MQMVKEIADEMKRRTSQLFKEELSKRKAVILNHENIIIAFFFYLYHMACSNTKNLPEPPLGRSEGFDKQGHRGCRGLMPENTFPAMKTALDLGVTTLEMDVVITKDKKVVLSHEPFFNHEITTKPDGSLCNRNRGKVVEYL